MIPSADRRSVLVTGCSSGIGYCVAKQLSARGYQVIASARKQNDVSRLNAEGLLCIHLDLNDSCSIKSAVQETLQLTHGNLYALFNNGAYGQAGAVEDLPREAVRAQFETNVFGWIELINYVIPIMRKQGYGRIIQNSSVLGLAALKFRGAYVASKYAIEGFTDTLRLELHGSNIYTSLIEPGPIESKFRINGHRAFQKYINPNDSVFRTEYAETEQRLLKKGAASRFTLPASAITPKVIHALESKQPKSRYYVTFPTYLFASLKRILSTNMLDRFLRKVSN